VAAQLAYRRAIMALNPDDARRWCDRLATPYLRPMTSAVAAVATLRSQYFASYGWPAVGAPDTPPETTLFEIGSITKLFTAVLLAKFACDGRIEFDAPIGKICGEFAGLPEWITPKALATHTSGLPRLPFRFWQALAY
jgi:CubicO group peptidase (beta-lactamase class C family)